ncbi:unnamed protein product, partial [marine sediment metagenome]
FMFLPGELTDRYSFGRYAGEIEAYHDKDPAFARDRNDNPIWPPDYPFDDLDPRTKTINRSWRKFPADPRARW